MLSSGTARLHSLDAARGVLMSMGVLLHAANVYAPDAHWIVADPDGHAAFDLISGAIHVFRMPAFFWVSGFFAAMTFQRTGATALLRSRLPRLVVPLIATLVTLNVLQELLVASLSGSGLRGALGDGVNLYHLWFLVNLTVYSLCAAAALPALQRWCTRPGTAGFSPPKAAAVMILGSWGAELAARATGVAYVEFFGLTSLYSLARYAPFYAIGAVMFFRTDLRASFLGSPGWPFFPALALALAIDPMTRGHLTLMTELLHGAQLACIWVCIASMQSFFARTFSRPSAFTRIAGEASYTVYLFHHAVTVALALALLNFRLAPGFEFVTLATLTLATTLAIHYLAVSRVRVLSLLFNGRLAPSRVAIARAKAPADVAEAVPYANRGPHPG
jgi:glucan biosynthesis protein C